MARVDEVMARWHTRACILANPSASRSRHCCGAPEPVTSPGYVLPMGTAAGPRCRSTCRPPRPLLSLELAERQYLDLPDDARALVDQRLTLLESDPAGLPDPTYDAASDQWSAPIAERGLWGYAVGPEPATVVVLRLIALSDPATTGVVSLKDP